MSTSTLPNRRPSRWLPSGLHEVIGNGRIIESLASRLDIGGRGPNTAIEGGSGTGKNASFYGFLQSLVCPRRIGLHPCGSCDACKTFDSRLPDEGLFAIFRPRVLNHGEEPLNYFPVDCGSATSAELEELKVNLDTYSGHSIVFLDEAHRLARRRMDEQLLVPLEKHKNVTWFASTAHPGELDPMFRRRFPVRLTTEPPSPQELVDFIRDRCREFGLTVDDPASTMTLIAERSGRNVSECLSLLSQIAMTRTRRLDRQAVLDYPFLDGLVEKTS